MVRFRARRSLRRATLNQRLGDLGIHFVDARPTVPPGDLDHGPDQRRTHGPGHRSDQADGDDRDVA